MEILLSISAVISGLPLDMFILIFLSSTDFGIPNSPIKVLCGPNF